MQSKATAIHKAGIFFLRSPLLLLFVGIALAQTAHQINITFDPAATTIQWTLGDILHSVHGTFKMERGVISYNPFSGEASGLIEIDATSGQSGSPARDRRMHKNVLNSTQYRVITFRPNHVEGTFDQAIHGDFIVDGIFNLHGQDHPMKMKVSIQPKGNRLAIESHFAVPYVEWGLKDPSTLILRVNKEISIDVNAVATSSNEPGAKMHP